MGDIWFMKNKHLILIVPVAFILLLLGMLLYRTIAGPAKSWCCSPARPRGNDLEAWKKTITPVQQIEDMDENFFDNFTVSSDSNFFTIKHPSENPPDNPFAFELHETTPGEPLEIGDGTLEFSCMGTAYLDANQTISDKVSYRIYDQQLKSINNTDVSEFEMYALTEDANFRNSSWPDVQLFFKHQKIENVIFHKIKIFDGRTHKILATGFVCPGIDGFCYFHTHIPLWHRTPVDVVLDISYGPVKTFEFAPCAGEGFDAKNFKCRLISVIEGFDYGTRSSWSRENVRFHILKKVPPDKAELTFLFACLPAAHHLPVTFEFLDKDGNKLRTRNSSTSGYTHYVRLEQPLEKIAIIRAYYRTRRQRIVIHMPYLPGLPEENKIVKNLFDVHIPYVMFNGPGQVEQFLRNSLQLGDSRHKGRNTKNSIYKTKFPLEFRNVTIRDIAQRYAQGGTLSLDNDQLILEYPIPLWMRFKQFLQKVWP